MNYYTLNDYHLQKIWFFFFIFPEQWMVPVRMENTLYVHNVRNIQDWLDTSNVSVFKQQVASSSSTFTSWICFYKKIVATFGENHSQLGHYDHHGHHHECNSFHFSFSFLPPNFVWTRVAMILSLSLSLSLLLSHSLKHTHSYTSVVFKHCFSAVHFIFQRKFEKSSATKFIRLWNLPRSVCHFNSFIYHYCYER